MFALLDILLAIPPWLAAIGDGEEVSAALAAVLPEVRAGQLVLLGCQPSRQRLGKEGWSGSYLVTVARPGGGEPMLVRLQGTFAPGGPAPAPRQPVPFGDPAWTMTLADLGLVLSTEAPEAELPALPILTEPASARALLEQAIAAGHEKYDGYRLRACAPTIVRHKPGSRCTIRYALTYDDEYADRSWPDFVIAKTYRGNKGEIAWSGMQELWNSPMRNNGVRLAEPLAYLPDLNVLVQGPVREERTLKKAIRAAVASGGPADLAAVAETIRQTAAGLAALHRCGVQAGQSVTWPDEVAAVRRVVDQIGRYVPDVAQACRTLLERLDAIADAEPAGQTVPTHNSFRPEQVLLGGREIGFIDFDAFCQAEPAVDVAQFCASVRRLLESPAHRVTLTSLAEEFVTEYERHAPISRRRVASWEALELLSTLLHAWTKVKPDKAPEVLSALKAHLSEGLGWTSGLDPVAVPGVGLPTDLGGT